MQINPKSPTSLSYGTRRATPQFRTPRLPPLRMSAAKAHHPQDAGPATLTAAQQLALPPTLNWHLTPHCNYRCAFCFATFNDISETQLLDQLTSMKQVLQEVRSMGFTRITFVGGEPLLHPCTDSLIHTAKELGLYTCLVTNGSLLTRERLTRLSGSLDILAFSVDASSDVLHAQLGRGLRHEIQSSIKGNAHIARVAALCPLAHDLGLTLKINTVVTRLNMHDDMTDLIRSLAPARWKIFQVLEVGSQNTGSVEPLLITQQEFEQYVERAQQGMAGTNICVIPECDTRGQLSYDRELCHDGCQRMIGGHQAWQAVQPHFDGQAFVQRNGVWDYGQSQETYLREQETAAQAAAASAAIRLSVQQ